MFVIDKNLMPTPPTEGVAKAFTLESLIGFLGTKDPEQTYDFYNCKGRCLIGQYMAHCGRDWYGNLHYGKFCREFDRAMGVGGGLADIAIESPHTFGAALTRARAALGAV